MKIFMLVLFFASFALCQNSTNPDGYPFFSPTLVKELRLNSTVSSTQRNQTHNEFYYVWVPENVGSVRYTLSSTGDQLCTTNFGALFDFIEIFGGFYVDLSIGFPCNSGGSYLCADWNAVLVGSDSHVFYMNMDFSPGQYQYITVISDASITCSYNLTAEVEFQCPDHQAPVYSSFTCVDFTNVTNGQVVSNTIQSQDQVDVYRFFVPQNVSRVWVGLTSNTTNLQFMNGVGYAVTDAHDNYGAVTSLGYNETTGLYYWVTEIILPNGDYPIFFAVKPSDVPVTYDISFYYSSCGSNSTGLGSAQYAASTELISFSEPDCSQPYAYNQLPLMNGTYSIGIPSDGYEYITFSVPQETVGYLSIECKSAASNSSVYISLVHNQIASDYIYMWCGTGNTPSSVQLLSQMLWIGGQWSIAVHNTYENSDNVTFTVTALGVTSAPSPGASPSPGTNSPSPSSQVDSGASKMLPVLLFVFLAAALVQM